MAKGPLAVRWLDSALEQPRAGAAGGARVELENAGTIAWGPTVFLSYHWLDERGNPLVWDGIRTPAPPLAPGERAAVEARVRAPIPPGRYRLAFDLVSEHRAWFAELGGEPLDRPVEVLPREGRARAPLPRWVEPGADWRERVDAAHAEGYAVVAGAVDWDGGLAHPRPRSLDPYRPGPGRVPGFPHPLLCPSVLDGIELERLPDVAGLPAYAPPADEPWVWDGRIVLGAHPARRA
ncbi:MAG TPA: hypothetical protein VFB42_14205 [Gaiellaceae bacterium]|nr:hypothetical protein [Gaiellaceae bacterium]